MIGEQHPCCRAIQLTVHPENQRAQRLYAGAGFRPVGRVLFGEPVYALDISGD
jgi:RimJ/RimL family protein N-acetyltransferase